MDILVPHSWLREYCDTNISPRDIAGRVSLSGPSIDRVHTDGKESVYEAEITTNRPDGFSVHGFAREVAALLDAPFREFFTKKNAARFEALKKTRQAAQPRLSIQIQSPVCRRYAGILLDGVRIAPSPQWMQERLQRAGQRPINNVVDITNYVMLELGQPLHAFDADRVAGRDAKEIMVRAAKKGEKIMTLDGQEKTLDPSVCVIADAKQALAIAGIKGGAAAGIGESTRSVILESANFEPVAVRTASRTVDIRTDSSARYEKNLSPEYVPFALVRAIELFEDLAGARVASAVVDVYPKKEKPLTISFDFSDIRRILGVDVSRTNAIKSLKSLGFSVTGKENTLDIEIPFWRRADMAEEGGNGIVEEVARMRGYADLPGEPIRGAIPSVPRDPSFAWERDTKRLLRDTGWHEIMTYSFISEKCASLLGEQASGLVKIHNPLTIEFAYMRPNLAGSILETLATNEQKKEELRIFELSGVYGWKSGRTNELPSETPELCLALLRKDAPRMLFREMKGTVDTLLKEWFGSHRDQICIEDVNSHPTRLSQLYEQGKGVRVTYGREGYILGSYGMLSNASREAFGISTPVAFCSINFAWVMSLGQRGFTFTPLPKYPAVIRDIAFLIEKRHPFASVVEGIKRIDPLIRDAELFDMYEKDTLGRGRQSLAVHVTYRSDERTLQTHEVDAVHTRVLEMLKQSFGAEIR